MPSITVRTVMTASGTAAPLTGSQFEFLPYNAFVEFGITGDATGVLATVQSGTDTLQEEGPIALGTINVAPKYPDEFNLNDTIGAGEKLSVKLRDTSGAVRTVMTTVRITPL